jgi:uncharacterized protein (DUF2267 family)
VDYEQLIAIVERRAGVDRETAERAIRQTLATMADRLDPGEARDIAMRLPSQLAGWIATTTPAEGFDVDDFVRRVAEGEGVDQRTAVRHARAVFGAIAQAIGPDEYADMVAELPRGFSLLLPRGRRVAYPSLEAFLAPIQERTGLDSEGARRAAEAALETLGERIAAGEVDDLVPLLPLELHDALRRGMQRGTGVAVRMPEEEFVQRIAAREAVGPDEARRHARAVFETLRQAVGEEFFDVSVQLPEDYTELLGSR